MFHDDSPGVVQGAPRSDAISRLRPLLAKRTEIPASGEFFAGGSKIQSGVEMAMQFRQMLNVLIAGIDSRAAPASSGIRYP
jgi:hypothetical protein